jgi:hypothetical protein
VPPNTGGDDPYPDDWFIPETSSTPDGTPIVPQIQPDPARTNSSSPFALPNVPAAPRPNPFEAYFALMPASLAGAMAWHPPIFPQDWPLTAAQNLPASPHLLTSSGLFSSQSFGPAPSSGDRLPPYSLLGQLANLGAPTQSIGSKQFPIFGSDGSVFASLAYRQDPPRPPTPSALLSGPPFEPTSGIGNQQHPLSGKLAAWVPPTTQAPWIGPGRFPNFGSNGTIPASFGALPAAAYEPTSFAADGGSFNRSNLTNSASSPFSRFLNALNPISSANAAEDEGGGLPPALLQAVIQGLIDAATAKRLIEQNRILQETQDARRELFEVAQGRASSRALGVALEASGVQRPEGYAAHHIAAGADPRAEFARGILKKFGIGINDASNGVFLPADRATQVIAGETIHSTLHTKKYYEAVNDALAKANTRQQVIDILQSIRLALQSGDYP